MFSDTEIEYWAEIYIKLGISEYQFSFDSFLTDPASYLREIGQESALECINNGFEPLLAPQAKIVLKLRGFDSL